MACGNSAAIASGKPFRPSTTASRIPRRRHKPEPRCRARSCPLRNPDHPLQQILRHSGIGTNGPAVPERDLDPMALRSAAAATRILLRATGGQLHRQKACLFHKSIAATPQIPAPLADLLSGEAVPPRHVGHRHPVQPHRGKNLQLLLDRPASPALLTDQHLLPYHPPPRRRQ